MSQLATSDSGVYFFAKLATNSALRASRGDSLLVVIFGSLFCLERTDRPTGVYFFPKTDYEFGASRLEKSVREPCPLQGPSGAEAGRSLKSRPFSTDFVVIIGEIAPGVYFFPKLATNSALRASRGDSLSLVIFGRYSVGAVCRTRWTDVSFGISAQCSECLREEVRPSAGKRRE